MYRLKIVDVYGEVVFKRCFVYKKDIIEFTKGKISYNDFKKRHSPKKYKTYKDFFVVEKL